MKVKKGDSVIVTIGKDKGKRGKIEKVFPKEMAVLVPSINVYKRHLKKRDEKNPGGIIDRPVPIALSKLVVICPSCGKPTRIGYILNKNEKVRICRKCKQKI